MPRMVAIADDLTGAADCAASSAAHGYKAVVLLYSPGDQDFEAGWPDADIVSIDSNSRCLPVAEASELTAQLVRQCHSQNTGSRGYVLYKKIDSTLRGNVASELSALLQACRSVRPEKTKLSVVMSPALPSQGRTMVDGRLLVHGVPLEKTDLWQTEARLAESSMVQLLAPAGLSCELIDTRIVRSGWSRLRKAMSRSAEQADVVLCDAETDEDLRTIAEASLGVPAIAALVGSAGLASQVPQAIGVAPYAEGHGWSFAPGATLFVVGTGASASREQARVLENDAQMAAFHASPAVLRDAPVLRGRVMKVLQSNGDVLLRLDGAEHCSNHDWRLFAEAMSDLVSKCAPFLGGLVATGGETARAVLDALGIRQLRLLGEVEPGLPFSVAERWVRPFPVITKAGAFGSPEALVRCCEFLRKLERVAESEQAKASWLDHMS